MVILMAHGSRDPAWRGSLEALSEALNSALPSDEVRLAFMQFTGPTLADVVGRGMAEGARTFRDLPLFMAGPGHVEKDIRPLVDALRSAHPEAEIELMTPLGEDPLLPGLLLDIINRPPTGA